MELDKQQIKRLRERHHRRHGIRPAHSEAMENASRFLKRAFNIREGRAPYHVIRKRFVNGARLTGSHLCILIIAMLIASIGLDIDSDIAIVGAMLICPLMGSVLAMAYGIATLDREITVEAIASLALQMVFCLVTSTLYFKLSPLGTTTAAIIDNSTPTVWDLAVALAGGFAGGLGNSRDQEPATLIAGVAVATALMPPLCAAGYGIAIASGSLFLSALYEFGINVIFIALAAEAVLLLLRVPLKRDLNGDGKVVVQVDSYTVDFDAANENTDAYYQMAGVTRLSAELSSGGKTYIFLLEDPEGFEAQTGALQYLDGTVPDDPETTDADWREMVYRWTDCPVLTGLDLGCYEGLTLMDDVTGTNQSVLAHLYVGRRGVWDEKQVPTYEGCAELWDTLTAGAVSTAAE